MWYLWISNYSSFWLHFLGNQLQLHFHFSKHNFTFDIYFWIFKDFFQTLCIFWFVFLSSLSLNFIMKKLYIGCSNKFWTGILQKNSYVIKGKKIVKVCLHFSKQCISPFNLTNFFENFIFFFKNNFHAKLFGTHFSTATKVERVELFCNAFFVSVYESLCVRPDMYKNGCVL